MSTPALDALHRVALEVGVAPIDPPAHLATAICSEYRRTHTENIALGEALERANHRISILEGTVP